MYISQVTIRNFRNFANATFKFEKGINTLIGENGSGKTNVFYAIRLLLDDSLSRRATMLEENDFTRCLNDWRGHWIIIDLEFDELDLSEGTQVLSIHGIANMEKRSKGKYSFYFRPKKLLRKKLFDLSQDEEKDKEKLQAVLSEITIESYESVFSCRGKAKFSSDETYKKYVGDFETIVFPDPEDKAEDELGTPPPPMLSIPREVSCTFIKALRDVVSDLKNAKMNPLLQLLKGHSQNIEVKKANSITDRVKELNKEICGLDEIKAISKGIKDSLKNTVGITYAPRIDIKSELPDDIEKLLQSLNLWVGDASDSMYQGQVRELSLGGANLIYLSLKLLEYELKQVADRAAHFLLIEEPEAHIHTHIQKTLFDKYEYPKTQVIISTHSTHISAASKIRSVNILCKGSCESHVYHPSEGLDPDECNRLERYLDAVRSTLLFAKGVILVEGDAELILIPAMFKAVFGITLDEIGISLINVSSTVFTNIAQIFDDKRIKRKCAIITDLDASIITLGKKEDDDEYLRSCRNSQKSGAERKEKLDEFCKENQWVRPFFANYTFEVDFLANDNLHEIELTLKSIYKIKAARDNSYDRLKSQEIAEAGKEILRLAEKEGKGWFALKLAEHMNVNTFIPKYILEAIAFASSHISNDHFVGMAQYRIKQGIKNKDQDFIDLLAKVKEFDPDQYDQDKFLEIYYKELADDQLTEFMKCIILC